VQSRQIHDADHSVITSIFAGIHQKTTIKSQDSLLPAKGSIIQNVCYDK